MWSDEVTDLGTRRNANCQLHNLNVGWKGVVRDPETIHEYIRLANHTVLYRIIFYNNLLGEYSHRKRTHQLYTDFYSNANLVIPTNTPYYISSNTSNSIRHLM